VWCHVQSLQVVGVLRHAAEQASLEAKVPMKATALLLCLGVVTLPQTLFFPGYLPGWG